MSAPSSKTTLIDAFAGAGGNTIAFALSARWERIFAVEKDPAALACAKHNAEIYGVGDKIWWIEGDIFSMLRKRLDGVAQDAVIFGSPPWGGTPAFLCLKWSQQNYLPLFCPRCILGFSDSCLPCKPLHQCRS